MAAITRTKLYVATIVYWVLLLYVIAALTWWSYELVKQTEAIYQLKKENLEVKSTSLSAEAFQNEMLKIEDQRQRNIYKYLGEGITFLLLILFGAVFIYRSVRRQFKLHLQQQNFVMAVSHELKTPIAVSRLNLETMQKYRLDEEKKQKLLQTTLQETLRLDNLINNILISSQLEGNSYSVQKEETDLSRLAGDVVQQFRSRYPQRELKTNIADDISVFGDPLLLKLLLSNLLENAAKYSPVEKAITLEILSDEKIILTVTDEGPGIPADERKNVFKKFYRMGSEKTRKTQGTGLGLFICKKIAQDHGGSIAIKDNYPEGSKFIVQLPQHHGK